VISALHLFRNKVLYDAQVFSSSTFLLRISYHTLLVKTVTFTSIVTSGLCHVVFCLFNLQTILSRLTHWHLGDSSVRLMLHLVSCLIAAELWRHAVGRSFMHDATDHYDYNDDNLLEFCCDCPVVCNCCLSDEVLSFTFMNIKLNLQKLFVRLCSGTVQTIDILQ